MSSHPQIRHSITTGKTGDEGKNEDRIVITPDFLAVIDGATAKGPRLIDGHTSGWLAAEFASDAIRSLPQEATAREAIDHITRHVDEQVRKAYGEKPEKDEPTASLALYSIARREIWRVGDCPVAWEVDGVWRMEYGDKKIDTVNAAYRSARIHAALAEGMSEAEVAAQDVGREAIWPMLTRQYLFANSEAAGEYGYGVINGAPVPDRFIEIFDVRGANQCILASDGYLTLCPTWPETEAATRAILTEDPLMYRLSPSTKGVPPGGHWHDDRTYLLFAA